jgi:hypothetical protein
VRDKTRANFCEWFQPGIGNAPGNKQNTTTPSSRSELDKLFGE